MKSELLIIRELGEHDAVNEAYVIQKDGKRYIAEASTAPEELDGPALQRKVAAVKAAWASA